MTHIAPELSSQSRQGCCRHMWPFMPEGPGTAVGRGAGVPGKDCSAADAAASGGEGCGCQPRCRRGNKIHPVSLCWLRSMCQLLAYDGAAMYTEIALPGLYWQ